jgi:outer membrane PBP1 activator LpoA protein
MRKGSMVAASLCAWILAACGSAGLALPPDTAYIPGAPGATAPAAPVARLAGPQPEAESFPVVQGRTAAIVPASSGQAAPAEPAAPVRMALLLPLHSEMLGAAARAIRDGFMAAYEREPAGATVTEFDTSDNPAQILQVYDEAQREHDLVVGPLLRQAVTAIAQSGRVDKPTIALNQPESQPNGDPAELTLPPRLMTMGLSVEEEARQAARWADTDHPGAPAWAVFGHAQWQKRAARAFAAQRLSQGLPTMTLQVAANAGDMRNADLVKLHDGLQDTPGALLFMALDPATAREARGAIGRDVPVYATSQLNPNVLTFSADPMPALDGVRLLDMPWQLQNDYAPALVYPRPAPPADAQPNADLARLYALGIDAYRVARELAVARHEQFDLDGLTGKLRVRGGQEGWHVEREAVPAVYRDGVAQPWKKP